MPTYTLDLAFTPDELSVLYATGSNVVVAKPNNGGAPNVAWIVFKPLESNVITWEEDYGIYASHTELAAGGILTQLSSTPYPAVPAKIYELQPSGAFGEPGPNGQAGSYSAKNSYAVQPYLTFGLFQQAIVNGNQVGNNPVSAAPVLYQSTAQITPFTTVYVWIQSNVVSSSVITSVTSTQTKVTFGGPVTSASLAYDPSSGQFNPVSAAASAGGATLEYLEPML